MSKEAINELKRLRSILSAVTGLEDDDQEYVEDARKSVDQIIAALAEQPAQQDPVGKVNELFDESVIEQCGFDRELLVYTTPQPAQRKPLTVDQIRGIYEDCDAPTSGLFTIAFARAIESAHGIKENT